MQEGVLTYDMEERLIKSDERVKDHGEVYTPKHIVDDMLELVKDESYRLDSTFLEPAAGNGNFLVEILRRKLETAKELGKGQLDRNTFIAVTSIYSIDILLDNVMQSKERMKGVITKAYGDIGVELSEEMIGTINYVMDKNIIWGNTLEGKRQDTEEDIEIIEWEMDGDSVTRKVYNFKYIGHEMLGETPIREYEPIDFRKLGNTGKKRRRRKRRSVNLIDEL